MPEKNRLCRFFEFSSRACAAKGRTCAPVFALAGGGLGR